MKKLLSLMLVAGLSVSGLVACGGNEETPQDPEGSTTDGTNEETETPKDPVEIKLWLESDELADALVPAIEEALPHIEIVYEKVGGTEAGYKIELDGPAGIGADVFMTQHDSLAPLIEGGNLLPLGDEINTMINDRFLEAAAGTVVYEDITYGIPLATENVALFYNKTLLEENGFELATSFEEIKEQAATYNDPSNNKFLMRFQAGNAYDMHFFLTAAGYEVFGPEHNNPDQMNMDTDEAIAGLEYFASMKEFLPVPAQDLNWDTVHGEFVKGNVPYAITGPWSINEARQAGIDNDFEWGVTTIPTINGEQPRVFSGNMIGCISSFTKQPDAAREVLDFIASDEGLQILYEVGFKIPALKDASTIPGVMEDPYVSGILAQAAHADATPAIAEIRSYWAPAQTAFQSVWEGLATPEEAAAKALEDYKLALEVTE